MVDLQEVSFKIIAEVGCARSNYIKAIDYASEGDFEKAEQMLAVGKGNFHEGHKAHAELLTLMANGELPEMNLLLAHAEDLMTSAEAFGILGQRFVDLYKKLDEKEK